jgi:hypothetical protein
MKKVLSLFFCLTVLMVSTFSNEIDSKSKSNTFFVQTLNIEDEGFKKSAKESLQQWWKNDPLFKIYFDTETSIYLSWASQKEIDEGCLNWELKNVYSFSSAELYELSCKCWEKYSSYLWDYDVTKGKIPEYFERPYASILVFINKQGHLQRLNLMPLGKPKFSIKKGDRAIKALYAFIESQGWKLKEMFREDIASLFISGVCFCGGIGSIPTRIDVITDYPVADKNQLVIVATYNYSKCKFKFRYGKGNEILSVNCECANTE